MQSEKEATPEAPWLAGLRLCSLSQIDTSLMCFLLGTHRFHSECYFVTLLFSLRLSLSCFAQILPIEDVGEVSTLHPTLISLEEDVFQNFTKHIRSDGCSFPCSVASVTKAVR